MSIVDITYALARQGFTVLTGPQKLVNQTAGGWSGQTMVSVDTADPVSELASSFEKVAQNHASVAIMLLLVQLFAHFGCVYVIWKIVRKCLKTLVQVVEGIHRRKYNPSSIAQARKNLGNPKTKKLKILMLSESVPPQINGIARRVGCYVDSLKELGHDVTEFSARTEQHCIPFPNLWQMGNKMMIVRPGAWLRFAIADYDVVHAVLPLNLSTFFFFQTMLVKYLLTGKRPVLVASWHCNIGDYVPRFMPSKTPDFVIRKIIGNLMWCVKPCITMADRLLLPTLATEPDLTRQLPKLPLAICPTGVNTEAFSSEWKKTPEGKEWLRLKQEDLEKYNAKKLLLYVGRFSPEKSLDKLLLALKLMEEEREENGGCVLWLVGRGPLEPSLRQEVEENKLPVRFCGFQTGAALSSVYTAGDVFVSASLTETFGQTVSEALASGLNVAIPSTECFEAAFGQFSQVVKLWEVNDDEDMVNAIKAAQKSKQQGMSEPLPSWVEATAKLTDEYRNGAVHLVKRTNAAEALMASLPWVLFFGLVEIVLFLVTMIESFVTKKDQAKNKIGMKMANCFLLIFFYFVMNVFFGFVYTLGDKILFLLGWPLGFR